MADTNFSNASKRKFEKSSKEKGCKFQFMCRQVGSKVVSNRKFFCFL